MAEALARVPLFARVLDRLRDSRSPIFMLHRVIPEGEICYDPEMVTSTDLFASFLDWICDRYRVVPLDEVIRQAGKAGNGNQALCALTFDDGWRDTFLHAFPLLRERQLPATVFLPVRFAGTNRRFWQERLWLRFQEPRERNELDGILDHVSRRFPWCPPLSSQRAAFGNVREILLGRPSQEAEEFVEALDEAAGSRALPADRAFLNWDEIRTMQNSGITFGSHTLNHTLLTRADPETMEHEIRNSRGELAEHLDTPVTGFSYPWGATGAWIRDQVKKSGYDHAVTIKPSLVPSRFDPFSLPRLAVSNSFLRGRDERFAAGRVNFYVARMGLHTKSLDGVSSKSSHQGERVRLAFVIDSIDSWEDGGTEKQLRELLSILDRNYFEPELYFLRPSLDLTAKDFPCPVRSASERADGRWSRVGVLLRLVQFFRRQRPHIVQTFFRDGTYYGALAAWMSRVPLIVISRRNAGYWKRTRDRLALMVVNRLGDFWQCNSRTVFESLNANEAVPPNRIDILPNVVDLAAFSSLGEENRISARKRLGLSSQAPVFVAVANLSPVKDPETLLEATLEVHRALPDAQFLLVGEGPLRGLVEARIREMKLGGAVRLAGAQSDVRPFLAAADVGVLTSRSEGSSNSLLEYMAAGLPAVVSDISANRELVSGVFFEPGNPRDLAQKILAVWPDAGLRALMQQEYRCKTREFSTEKFARRAQSYFLWLAAKYLTKGNGNPRPPA